MRSLSLLGALALSAILLVMAGCASTPKHSDQAKAPSVSIPPGASDAQIKTMRSRLGTSSVRTTDSLLTVAAKRGIDLIPVSPAGEAVTGKQWLLVIGINDYRRWPKLKTPVNDARALKDILEKRYYYDPDHVIELYDADATRAHIIATLRRLASEVGPDDSLLIYYAGHGQIDGLTKAGSWIPVESDTNNPAAWLSNHDILSYLRSDVIKAKHVLLISDSCFAGDFFRGVRGKPPEITEAFLKKAYTLSSRQAITSGGLEPVSDDGFGGHSVFAHFMLAALERNQTPFLTPSAMFSDIRAGVADNADQLPTYGNLKGTGGQQGGEMVLFLRQEQRAAALKEEAQQKWAELQQLKQKEAEVEAAREKENAEVAKQQAALDDLDAQIKTMRSRLGTSSAGSTDSLDSMLALVTEQEQRKKDLEALKQKREAEEAKRESELKQQRQIAFTKDFATYHKIVSSEFGASMKEQAWQSLVKPYPEAAGVAVGDVAGLIQTGLLLRLFRDAFIDGNGSGAGPEMVRLPGQNFAMGKYEVTQGQWRAIMGSNPSHFTNCGNDCPVENVSWKDAQNYIEKLNQRTGQHYRLPSRQEWEAACLAGKRTEYCGSNHIDEVAWYGDNSGLTTHPVGRKRPNAWGLYDLSGNVGEWTSDCYDGGCGQRVYRGGSCYDIPRNVRAALRHGGTPDGRGSNLGFRLARNY